MNGVGRGGLDSRWRALRGCKVKKLQEGYLHRVACLSCLQERIEPEDTSSHLFNDKRWTPPSEEYTGCIMIDRAGRGHDVASPGLREGTAPGIVPWLKERVRRETAKKCISTTERVPSFSGSL